MLKQKKQKSLYKETKETIIFFIICAIVVFILGVSLVTGDIVATILFTSIFVACIIPLAFTLLFFGLAVILLLTDDIF